MSVRESRDNLADHDEYVRDAGTWRINRRQYDPLLFRADDVVTASPFPTDVPNIE